MCRRRHVPLQKKVSFEPTTSYLLKNLKPFSAYTFQLAARSKHGIGAYTNEISIDTPQTRKFSCMLWSLDGVCEKGSGFIWTMQK